jgi:Plasmid encoded RepA protein
LLFWLTSEALRTGERKIQLGSTYNQFIRAVGLSTETGGGKRGDARRLQDQTRRLFTTNISFIYAEQRPTGPSPEARLNMNVASRSLIWWDPRRPDQMSFFDNWIELSQEFFQAITAAPVPLDTRALKALKRSPLALDLYAWATHKALTVARRGRQQFIPWKSLSAQFGADYNDHHNFKKKAQDAFRKIEAVFPGLKLQSAIGGIVVLPTSRPAIASKPSKRRALPPSS